MAAVPASGAMVLCLEAAPPRVRALSALWRDAMPRVPRDPAGPRVVGRNDGAVDESARGAIKQQQQLVVIDAGRVNATRWDSAPTGNVENALELS